MDINVYVYLVHNYRGSISKLYVKRGDKLKYDDPETGEGIQFSELEIWEKMKDMDRIFRIAKIGLETLMTKRWLIVQDLDFDYCVASDGFEQEKYYLTDEDPMKYIARRFIRSIDFCRTENENCKYIHSEDVFDNIDITFIYCEREFYSAGERQIGIRVVNVNEKYPDTVGELPNARHGEDYNHMIYIFDVKKLGT